MRLLLDTHTFIWAATLDERLSSKAKTLLLDSDNELLLSTASIWEMAIKTSLGKLILKQPIEQTINEQIQINGLQILNIESAHALAMASLPWHHRDPFDRLLICQGKLENLIILGRDSVMDAYGVDRVW
ncbi:MAG: type II toxin-antitoxin system VapC family toxin [Mariprofundaceae bacterium]|nr:type II toxin-antitoxin system VapC family toxin [Mariprofundaceae bacterium]